MRCSAKFAPYSWASRLPSQASTSNLASWYGSGSKTVAVFCSRAQSTSSDESHYASLCWAGLSLSFPRGRKERPAANSSKCSFHSPYALCCPFDYDWRRCRSWSTGWRPVCPSASSIGLGYAPTRSLAMSCWQHPYWKYAFACCATLILKLWTKLPLLRSIWLQLSYRWQALFNIP